MSTYTITAIKKYQTYISPYKGYRCACSVVYGGTGCSGAVIQLIEEHGLFNALPYIRQRFLMCRQANEENKRRISELLEIGAETFECLPDLMEGCSSCG